MDWKEKIRRDIFEKNRPTLLLGSGASIATGISLNLDPNFPSMADLANCFCDKIETDGFSSEEITAFNAMKQEFKESCHGAMDFNLEAFLKNHPFRQDSRFLQQILKYTAEALKPSHDSLAQILEMNPRISYPLLEMIKSLAGSLPASDPELRIVTPNYDLLVEFTADLIGIPYLNGFCGGIIRYWNPERGFIHPSRQRFGKPFPANRIRLIKPHGSFSWFQSGSDKDIFVEKFTLRDLNGDWRRLMVIPGPTKYFESLNDICRDHMNYMDQAIKNAQSLFVIGYGFNDPHLEVHLKRRLSSEVPAIYVTKNLSDSALKTFVFPYHNVTCIMCDDANGSRIYRGDKEINGHENDRLWILENFVQEFIR